MVMTHTQSAPDFRYLRAASGNAGPVEVVGGGPTAAATAGGAVTVTGGAGTTSGAGGAVSVTGGVGGTTGVGGATIMTSGAGGTTSGASGVVTIESGTTAVHTTATAGATGAISVTSGDPGTATTGTAGASGAVTIASAVGGLASGAAGTAGNAGDVAITGGAGGASTADGGSDDEVAGLGGNVLITGGAGGLLHASASTVSTATGGDVILTAGDSGAADAGTRATAGQIILRPVDGQPVMVKMAVPSTSTTGTAMTEAELLGGIHIKSPTAAQNFQLPNGTEISAAIGASLVAGDGFEFTLINTGTASDIVTITEDTGINVDGNGYMGVHPAADGATLGTSVGRFYCRNTGANTWEFYRVG